MRSKFQQEADGTPELRRFKTVLFAKVWEGVGKPYEVVQKPGANGRGAVTTTQPEGPGGRGLGDLRHRPIRTALPGLAAKETVFFTAFLISYSVYV